MSQPSPTRAPGLLPRVSLYDAAKAFDTYLPGCLVHCWLLHQSIVEEQRHCAFIHRVSLHYTIDRCRVLSLATANSSGICSVGDGCCSHARSTICSVTLQCRSLEEREDGMSGGYGLANEELINGSVVGSRRGESARWHPACLKDEGRS